MEGVGHLHLGDVGRLGLAWATSALGLGVVAALIPNLSATSPWAWVAVSAVVGIVALLLRPVLVELSARLGWLAVLLVALVGQALILYGAMLLVPGIEATFVSALVASWAAAALGTAVQWLTTSGTDDALVMTLMRRGRPDVVEDAHVPGFLFVQLDGVPFPVLQWAVQSGGVPTIREWLLSERYVLREWTPQFPCTTPASQLGILHGTIDAVPAFRWYDRELGRVLVANRPADARIIEGRASDGRGLLADDGVSISNLFTGDAARSFMTMSRIEPSRGSTETRRIFARFTLLPSGFARSMSRTLAEVARERWQARRQERRRLQPRVHRGWTFAALRAVTNGVLRDLNTALIAQEMRKGTRAIYVDYVDYDEVAHHAGLTRPESLAVLEALDRLLASLELLRTRAARDYHLVVLSDHGQSQGRSFADRHGQTLAEVCAELMSADVTSVDTPVEGLGRAQAVTEDVGDGSGVGRLASRADAGLQRRRHEEQMESGASVVLGSGNLGLLYTRQSRRHTLESLDAAWPRLIPGLVEHPGVLFVAGVDAAGRPWAIGPAGRQDLASGAVEGASPLSALGEHAARVLARAVLMPQAPDLYINSAIDPTTGDVAAFEELVGAHGGLGGWQDRAMLLVPAPLAGLLPDRIEGADTLHRSLVRMLEDAGHRGALVDRPQPRSPRPDLSATSEQA
jgi:uncharacterized membrane protein YvlD (DUF360 family)